MGGPTSVSDSNNDKNNGADSSDLQLTVKDDETIVATVESDLLKEKELLTVKDHQQAPTNQQDMDNSIKDEENPEDSTEAMASATVTSATVTTATANTVHYHTSSSSDEETGAYATASDDFLIKAELVDDTADNNNNININNNKPLVDAQVLEDDPDNDKLSPEMKQRKRMIQYLALVVIVAILSAVIVLSVVLSNDNNNNSNDQDALKAQQNANQVFASSSPTVSQSPSFAPSLQPSRQPTSVPSDSPTQLTFQQLQVLDGLTPALPIETSSGFGEFGNNVLVSDITGTELANRTGYSYILAASYGGVAVYGAGGAPLAAENGAAIYLCQSTSTTTPTSSDNDNDNDTTPCELMTILGGIVVAPFLLLKGVFLLQADLQSWEMYDLSNIDSHNISNPPDSFVKDNFIGGTVTDVAMNDDGSLVMAVSANEFSGFEIGTFDFPPIPGFPPPPPMPPMVIGSFIEQSPQTPPCPPDAPPDHPCNIRETNYALQVVGPRSHTIIVTIKVQLQLPAGCSGGLSCIFIYDSYTIHRDTFGMPSSTPEFVTGFNTSLFSTDGLAVNSDATVVAVSSGGAPNGLTLDQIDFQVNVYRLNSTDQTAWEVMGSTIRSPHVADYFGKSLSLNAEGTFLVVGADTDSTNGQDSGKVYSFEWDAGMSEWIPFGVEDLEGVASSRFGKSTSLSGDGRFLAVGAPEKDLNGENSGEVTTYAIGGV